MTNVPQIIKKVNRKKISETGKQDPNGKIWMISFSAGQKKACLYWVEQQGWVLRCSDENGLCHPKGLENWHSHNLKKAERIACRWIERQFENKNDEENLVGEQSLRISKSHLAQIIKEEITKIVEAIHQKIPSIADDHEIADIDPDQLSFHDVINDEGPEHDAWERLDSPDEWDLTDWWPGMKPQHKRPSVEKELQKIRDRRKF